MHSRTKDVPLEYRKKIIPCSIRKRAVVETAFTKLKTKTMGELPGFCERNLSDFLFIYLRVELLSHLIAL